MATRQILVDDLTGQPGEDVQTVTFGLDGRTYELDLGPETRADLVTTLQPYLQHARTTSSKGRTKGAARRAAAPKSDLAPLRHWARMNGFTVGDRGRIPANIRDAYVASGAAQ